MTTACQIHLPQAKFDHRVVKEVVSLQPMSLCLGNIEIGSTHEGIREEPKTRLAMKGTDDQRLQLVTVPRQRLDSFRWRSPHLGFHLVIFRLNTRISKTPTNANLIRFLLSRFVARSTM